MRSAASSAPIPPRSISWGPASAFLRKRDTAGLVDGDAHVARRTLVGERANEDTWIAVGDAGRAAA